MIRKAQIKDAQEFCNVLRTSIIELCKIDHKDNKNELDEWLSNKTVENCKKMILNKSTNTFVAEKNGKVVGVSHMGHNGYLYLCYLIPEVKGQGIGGKLLSVSEESVMHFDFKVFTLESTITSKDFYEHYGYISNDKTENCLLYSKVKYYNKL